MFLLLHGIFLDFLSTSEDKNIHFEFANLLRLIRMLALFITLFLPGTYIAITNFHQNIIPTELMFAIVASRENVPFPIIIEIIMMEVSFELIREAGVRIPSTLGSTIGIVGAIILRRSCSKRRNCKSIFNNYCCNYWSCIICGARFLLSISYKSR